jgi:hypothetical protein
MRYEAGPERREDSQKTVPDKSADGTYGFVAACTQESARNEEAATGNKPVVGALRFRRLSGSSPKPPSGNACDQTTVAAKRKRKNPMLLLRKSKSPSISRRLEPRSILRIVTRQKEFVLLRP